MCGIAGLFLKDPALEPELGRHLTQMLDQLTQRGPDSTGFAIYTSGTDGRTKLTVAADPPGQPVTSLLAGLEAAIGLTPEIRQVGTHAVVSLPDSAVTAAGQWLKRPGSGLRLVGSGHEMEIFKEVGLPVEVAERFDLARIRGTHAVGHTRMATESAVTTAGAHPFSTGADQCLVHNGSLSNHNTLRRKLIREGMSFTSDNDTEVAAAYLSWRMREGASLKESLEAGLKDLDGFYTFVVGTRTGFAVLRDAIACKPAVMAETDRFVAFGSEYRALANLPGIESAKVWEPAPATVYAWERN